MGNLMALKPKHDLVNSSIKCWCNKIGESKFEIACVQNQICCEETLWQVRDKTENMIKPDLFIIYNSIIFKRYDHGQELTTWNENIWMLSNYLWGWNHCFTSM